MSKISLSPPARMTELADRLEEVRNRDAASPCGSFTFAYHCMCDYYGVPFSEEVAWVRTTETIYFILLAEYVRVFELHTYFAVRVINVWNTLSVDRVHFSSFAALKRTAQRIDLSMIFYSRRNSLLFRRLYMP